MAMSIRRRGMARFARRKAERRLAVLGPIILFPGATCAVLRTDCISFSKPIRCARAFLVPRGHITRGRLTQGFGLGAFQRYNFLSHLSVTPSLPPAQLLPLRPRRLRPRSSRTER